MIPHEMHKVTWGPGLLLSQEQGSGCLVYGKITKHCLAFPS